MVKHSPTHRRDLLRTFWMALLSPAGALSNAEAAEPQPSHGVTPRVDLPTSATFTARQKATYDDVIRELGDRYDGGPFPILIIRPGVADAALRLLQTFRHDSKLERRLLELAILVIAAEWDSTFEWDTHLPRALTLGLDKKAMEAIRKRRVPAFARDDERSVFTVVKELTSRRKLPASAYREAEHVLGTDALVDLVAAAGFYTMIAMTLAAFAP